MYEVVDTRCMKVLRQRLRENDVTMGAASVAKKRRAPAQGEGEQRDAYLAIRVPVYESRFAVPREEGECEVERRRNGRERRGRQVPSEKEAGDLFGE